MAHPNHAATGATTPSAISGKATNARDWKLWLHVWPYVKPHSRYLGLAMLMMALLASLGVARPLLMGEVVLAAGEKNGDKLLRHGILLSVAVVLIQVLTFVQSYVLQVAGARAMGDLRRDLFSKCQRLSLSYLDKTPVGKLVSRVTNDVDSVGELFASGVLISLGDIALLVGIIATMLRIDAKLSVIAFASVPLVLLIVRSVRDKSREAYRDIRERTSRLNAFLSEQVSGIAVVQAYSREAAMAAEFRVINDEYRDANKRAVFYEAVLDASVEMITTLCVASILWWVGSRAGVHVGFHIVVVFTQYVRQFFEPISLLSQRYTVLQSAMSGIERIVDFEQTAEFEPRGVAVDGPSAVDERPVVLELENVRFAYKSDAPVLRGVNLAIRRGERVALVGATGAGKTTVASLFLGLYDVTEGLVRCFGRPIGEWDRQALRRRFAVVPQDVVLFTGTVLSNVGVGAVVPNAERAAWCMRQVGADDLLAARGLDAVVEERGMNFSAGEKQLIAFARALYMDAPVLVLDEATANIDSNTEAKLQVGVERLLEGRTALVIAHRLSTIRALDRIVVFKAGMIVEDGSHEKLLALGGVYARLYAARHEEAIDG